MGQNNIDIVGKYKVYHGTFYDINTQDGIIYLLDKISNDKVRVRFHWGDTKTGKDWGDTYDIKGYIGKSTGPIRIPILVFNKRSMGGHAILTHCIVKISLTKGGKVLYQHPNYHQ